MRSIIPKGIRPAYLDEIPPLLCARSSWNCSV